MAQERKIMVVALSQFSRASEARGRRAVAHRPARSPGQIEQDADAVLALSQERGGQRTGRRARAAGAQK
ncbi:MAG: DnaB-like helicase C-terminal domain-containing protein [Butyricicoccaceae bacterium]